MAWIRWRRKRRRGLVSAVKIGVSRFVLYNRLTRLQAIAVSVLLLLLSFCRRSRCSRRHHYHHQLLHHRHYRHRRHLLTIAVPVVRQTPAHMSAL